MSTTCLDSIPVNFMAVPVVGTQIHPSTCPFIILPTHQSVLLCLQVVVCDSGTTSDVLRYSCWSEARTPRAECSSSCDFGYYWGATPTIQVSDAQQGDVGTDVTLSGDWFQNLEELQFRWAVQMCWCIDCVNLYRRAFGYSMRARESLGSKQHLDGCPSRILHFSGSS